MCSYHLQKQLPVLLLQCTLTRCLCLRLSLQKNENYTLNVARLWRVHLLIHENIDCTELSHLSTAQYHTELNYPVSLVPRTILLIVFASWLVVNIFCWRWRIAELQSRSPVNVICRIVAVTGAGFPRTKCSLHTRAPALISRRSTLTSHKARRSLICCLRCSSGPW